MGSNLRTCSSDRLRRERRFESSPQKEAAAFYALFLRGKALEALRADIDFPEALLDKMLPEVHATERAQIRQMYRFRKRTLAIFDMLTRYAHPA